MPAILSTRWTENFKSLAAQDGWAIVFLNRRWQVGKAPESDLFQTHAEAFENVRLMARYGDATCQLALELTDESW